MPASSLRGHHPGSLFYSGDGDEPIQAQIERNEKTAKAWLEPPRLCSSGVFNICKISTILRIIQENREIMLEA